MYDREIHVRSRTNPKIILSCFCLELLIMHSLWSSLKLCLCMHVVTIWGRLLFRLQSSMCSSYSRMVTNQGAAQFEYHILRKISPGPTFLSSRHGPDQKYYNIHSCPDRGGCLFSNMHIYSWCNSPWIYPLQQMALPILPFLAACLKYYNVHVAIVQSLLLFWLPIKQEDEAQYSCNRFCCTRPPATCRQPPPSKELFPCFAMIFNTKSWQMEEPHCLDYFLLTVQFSYGRGGGS